ncbi:MAG: putative selenate ABC transporter substrate-binding protein [Planctomycetota bacterium]|jgi:phosphonate transport system substrate-binding protein|nr:putative selenate ABC transporter substrate-binding protein [Planctomycetota bacterium]MDP6989461.1 putative selenate ABC transporter substrate-binding protein [Planctomycetota bacterium]
MSIRSSLALSGCLLACACGGDAEAGGAVLRFSAIPDQNSTELEEKYGLLARHLTETLSVDVRYVPSSDYAASVASFANGDVQLAWFGGLTGVRARAAVEGARAIAQGAVDPRFRSYFVANASTGIEASDAFPEGLAGRTFTFGSESSTSGRLMPEHWIREHTSMAPRDFFAGEEMSFSGDHAKTALLVQEGTFEAGVLNYKVYESLVAEGRIDPGRCRVVWETPPYPDYNWTAHPDLERTFGAGFTERVQAALLGIEDPALLAALQREEGLIAASNEEFAPLAELAKQLDLLR